MTTHHPVLWPFAAAVLVLACASAGDPLGRPPDAPRNNAGVTLGTFDSRAVTIAYANSAGFVAYLSGLRQELNDAQAAGDDARVAELEAFGPALQAQLHRQGFSTGSVSNILEPLQDRLPAIARAAGVEVILSKWDIVYRAPSAAIVDVTHLLVAEFDPDEDTLRSIAQCMELDPIPLEEIDEVE